MWGYFYPKKPFHPFHKNEETRVLAMRMKKRQKRVFFLHLLLGEKPSSFALTQKYPHKWTQKNKFLHKCETISVTKQKQMWWFMFFFVFFFLLGVDSMLFAWLFWWEMNMGFDWLSFLVCPCSCFSCNLVHISKGSLFWFLWTLIPDQQLIPINLWVPSIKHQAVHSWAHLFLFFDFSFAVCFLTTFVNCWYSDLLDSKYQTNNHNPWSCIVSICETEFDLINLLYFQFQS